MEKRLHICLTLIFLSIRLTNGEVTTKVFKMKFNDIIVNVGENHTLVFKEDEKVKECRIFIPNRSPKKMDPKDNKCTYYLTDIKLSDNGYVIYDVLFNKDDMWQKSIFKLTVAQPPSDIDLTVSNKNIFKGDTLNAKCVVKNARPAAEIQWLLNNKMIHEQSTTRSIQGNITNNSNQSTVHDNTTYTTTEYLLIKDVPLNLTSLSCRAVYHVSNNTLVILQNKTRAFDVNIKPKRTNDGDAKGKKSIIFSVCLGCDESLSISYEGKPAPNVTWMVGYDKLRQNNSSRITYKNYNKENFNFVTTLKILNTSLEDIKTKYKLIIENKYSKMEYCISLNEKSSDLTTLIIVLGCFLSAVFGAVIAALVMRFCIRNRKKGSNNISPPFPPPLPPPQNAYIPGPIFPKFPDISSQIAFIHQKMSIDSMNFSMNEKRQSIPPPLPVKIMKKNKTPKQMPVINVNSTPWIENQTRDDEYLDMTHQSGLSSEGTSPDSKLICEELYEELDKLQTPIRNPGPCLPIPQFICKR